MDRRANIVLETGESEFFGPGSTTDALSLLYNENLATGPAELNGCGQPVGPRANNCCVISAHSPLIVPQDRYDGRHREREAS